MAKLKQGNEEGYVTVAILPSTRRKLRKIQQELAGAGTASSMWKIVDLLAQYWQDAKADRPENTP